MVSHHSAGPATAHPSIREGLLGPGLRRDLCDLNLMFLRRAVDPGMRCDPRFSMPDLPDGLLQRGPEMLMRAAACPFALFGLNLPEETGPNGVADNEAQVMPEGGLPCAGEQVLAFTHPLLSVVCRLVFVAPLALRLAFGLPPASESTLLRLLPSQQAWLARWVGLVRPRWPESHRFWETLFRAASLDCPEALQRAHCLGMCLPDSCQGSIFAAGAGPARRTPPRSRPAP